MPKKPIEFYKLSEELKSSGFDGMAIAAKLHERGATLAIAIKSLQKIGYDFKEIEYILQNVKAWREEKINLTDLFFDFVELDDDLV